MAESFEIIVDPQLALRTKLARAWPSDVDKAMATALRDIAMQAGRRVVERTPRPGHLEPPGGRTWIRTGNAARSISPGLSGQSAENIRTAARLVDPYARVVQNRQIANYVVPWLETGREKVNGTERKMRWPADGYRMFTKTKLELASIAQVVLNNVVRHMFRAG